MHETRSRRDKETPESVLEKAVESLAYPKDYRGRRSWEIVTKLSKRMLLSEIEFIASYTEGMTIETRGLFRYSLLCLVSAGKYRRHDSPLHHAVYLAALVTPLMTELHDAGMDDSIGIADASIMAASSLRWCRAKRMPEDFSERDHALIQGQMFEWLLYQWIESKIKTPSVGKDYYRWLSENRASVIEVVGMLKERQSAKPELIQELVENASKPLASGVL